MRSLRCPFYRYRFRSYMKYRSSKCRRCRKKAPDIVCLTHTMCSLHLSPALAHAELLSSTWINEGTELQRWRVGEQQGLLLRAHQGRNVQVKVPMPLADFAAFTKTIHLVCSGEQNEVLAICDLSCVWAPDEWYAQGTQGSSFLVGSPQRAGAICPCCGKGATERVDRSRGADLPIAGRRVQSKD